MSQNDNLDSLLRQFESKVSNVHDRLYNAVYNSLERIKNNKELRD